MSRNNRCLLKQYLLHLAKGIHTNELIVGRMGQREQLVVGWMLKTAVIVRTT